MQTQKMSLANIEGKLSRAEMKIIMVGSGSYTFNATAIPGYHVLVLAVVAHKLNVKPHVNHGVPLQIIALAVHVPKK